MTSYVTRARNSLQSLNSAQGAPETHHIVGDSHPTSSQGTDEFDRSKVDLDDGSCRLLNRRSSDQDSQANDPDPDCVALNDNDEAKVPIINVTHSDENGSIAKQQESRL